MSQDVLATMTDETGCALVAPGEAERIADAYLGRIDEERGRKVLPSLPTKSERAIMQARRTELERVVRPMDYASSDMMRARAAVGMLFNGYPSLRNMEPTAASKMVASYIQDLIELPALSVEQAVKDIKSNKVKDLDPDYPPSVTRLYALAERHRDDVRAEIGRYNMVLAVRQIAMPPMTDEQRERVSQVLRDAGDALRKTHERDDAEMKRRVMVRTQEANERLLIREYEQRGEIPCRNSHGQVISRSLAMQGGRPIEKAMKPNDVAAYGARGRAAGSTR